jgi:hypothetical protein
LDAIFWEHRSKTSRFLHLADVTFASTLARIEALVEVEQQLDALKTTVNSCPTPTGDKRAEELLHFKTNNLRAGK